MRVINFDSQYYVNVWRVCVCVCRVLNDIRTNRNHCPNKRDAADYGGCVIVVK